MWFDAMWEKIIMQRMTFAALVVVVIASITSTGLTWFVVGQAQQVNRALLDESKAGVAALLAESRKANEALLEKMTAAQGEANAAPSMEWNSVRVQMVPESPDGPPPSGFEVSLRGHLLDTANGMTLVRITGPDGMADFGLVRPGEHSLRFKASWGESSDRSVTVFPGKAQTVEVPYPTKIEDAEIAISVDWPGDLAGRDYWLMCDFVRTPRKVGDQSWSRDADVGLQMVVVTPVGSVINFDRATVKAWINEKFHEVPHVADYELRFFSVSC
ncbi:MAG: hypothetical protein EXS05_17365 [Planctomycetaceae bacterium]|nr:hypothetical protein [Planctomycetaceae bacterium]